MIYYVMSLHSQLTLLLLERNSSSLRSLFEDSQEVEENIHASRRIRERVYSENLQAHKQVNCEYGSDFEQESNEFEADLEHQQACEFISDSGQNSSIFVEYSRDRYACEFYDQFANQIEPMVTNDYIGNYMFLADPNPYDVNHVLLSSCDHYSEEEVVVFDDHKLISREPEDDQSSSRGKVMVEQEFSVDQHFSDLGFKDPVVAFMESYIPENPKISDFLNSSAFPGEYGFLNDSLSLLLHVKHHLLISDKDEIISVLKLLGWLLWKSTFT
jgi:hypothetical protein